MKKLLSCGIGIWKIPIPPRGAPDVHRGATRGLVARRRRTFYLLILFVLLSCPLRADQKILNGRILEINRKFDFVIINLGKDDGVKEGMVFMVYRGKKLLGKVVTEDIFPKMSSCIILPEWKQGRIKVDDGVLEE